MDGATSKLRPEREVAHPQRVRAKLHAVKHGSIALDLPVVVVRLPIAANLGKRLRVEPSPEWAPRIIALGITGPAPAQRRSCSPSAAGDGEPTSESATAKIVALTPARAFTTTERVDDRAPLARTHAKCARRTQHPARHGAGREARARVRKPAAACAHKAFDALLRVNAHGQCSAALERVVLAAIERNFRAAHERSLAIERVDYESRERLEKALLARARVKPQRAALRKLFAGD